MALFEGYERRIDKINGVLKQYGINSIEECKDICLSKGVDCDKLVRGTQPICFENAVWAYTVGAAIAGLGGLCYVMGYMNGIVGSTGDQTIQGIGWLSIALVIFTLWKPALAILGSIVFGALYILSSYITGISFEQIPLLNLIPYVVTILVLIVTSIVGHRETQPPASLGLSYFREDR